MVAPLVGIRVLDLTRNVAGPYATKLLADFGADVFKLEAREGDPSRRFGPFPGNEPHPERSGLFLFLNTNKRSATLDPASAESAETIRQLAAQADIVVEDFAPGEAARRGWGWETLRELNPGLVMASITPFGQTGPYRDYRGSELTLQAIGGPLHSTGHQDREPLKLAGHFAHYHAGLAAALAMMLARLRVERGSGGDWIDLAVYECEAGSRDRRTIQLTAAAYTGVSPRRATTAAQYAGVGVRTCVDGYVNLFGAANRLPALLKLIGREDLLARPGIDAPMMLIPPDLTEEIERSYAEYLARTPKLEAVAQAQALGILAGAIMSVGDLLRDPHYRSRGVWDTIDHPETGALDYPGRPFVMSASPRPQPRRAPLLGEHNAQLVEPWEERGDEVTRDEGLTPPHGADAPRSPRPERVGVADGPLALPLDGVRVADITVVWAGPHATQLLAEWGAEVIRVEPVNRIQPYTRGAETVISRDQAIQLLKQQGAQPMYPDMDPGDEPWNRNASFTSHARNKKSMACDIMSPAGHEAFLRLIARCDVLIENNVPETIDKAQIGWDVLSAVNPRLIMVRMPAFALTGPRRNYRAFGLHVEAMVGHTHLRGYPDAGPEIIGETLASDAISGVQAALAVTMALRHRERTGEGQLIELPLAEGFIPTLAEYMFDYTMNKLDPPPQGNGHRWHAPHNVYPTAGDDQWIAIDVASDEEFAALCEVIGAPQLAQDPRFASTAARHDHVAPLDEEIGALTAAHDKEALFVELQNAGVCAAPVHDALDALADPQLRARGFFEELPTPGGGTHRYPGLIFRMARTPNHLRTPPVRLGEHSRELYVDLLGYSPAEYERLETEGLVGTRYPESVLRR